MDLKHSFFFFFKHDRFNYQQLLPKLKYNARFNKRCGPTWAKPR